MLDIRSIFDQQHNEFSIRMNENHFFVYPIEQTFSEFIEGSFNQFATAVAEYLVEEASFISQFTITEDSIKELRYFLEANDKILIHFKLYNGLNDDSGSIVNRCVLQNEQTEEALQHLSIADNVVVMEEVNQDEATFKQEEGKNDEHVAMMEEVNLDEAATFKQQEIDVKVEVVDQDDDQGKKVGKDKKTLVFKFEDIKKVRNIFSGDYPENVKLQMIKEVMVPYIDLTEEDD